MCRREMGGGAVEQYSLPRSTTAAALVRNSLCMHIYSLSFGWVVLHLNELLSQPLGDSAGCVCIGLLDIFGFEKNDKNSFAQLCINYANEKLHNLFIELVIRQEQDVYIREGVTWKLVNYQDNQRVVDLIASSPLCLFSVLDDACKTGSGSDESVLNAFHATFAAEGREAVGYIKPKYWSNRSFIVLHYAGEVRYDIANFVDMNKDKLSLDARQLLETHSRFEKLRWLSRTEAERRAAAESGAEPKGSAWRLTASRRFCRWSHRSATSPFKSSIMPHPFLLFGYILRTRPEERGRYSLAALEVAGQSMRWWISCVKQSRTTSAASSQTRHSLQRCGTTSTCLSS